MTMKGFRLWRGFRHSDRNQLTGRGTPSVQELAKKFGVSDSEKLDAWMTDSITRSGNLVVYFHHKTRETSLIAPATRIFD
jgi:hypothetical protein